MRGTPSIQNKSIAIEDTVCFFLTNCLTELFQKIELPEVLLWAEKQSEELSPNLTKFTEHFNNMSYWVRTIILTQPDAKIREKLMIRFIKVMKVSA